ncbi:MAG: DUF1214 domain-containing protein [Pseudomonadota bacterium]
MRALTPPATRILFLKAKKNITLALYAFSGIVAFCCIVIVGGVGSSLYLVANGSGISTHSVGPWLAWVNEARPGSDPYTRAHFAQKGRLNLSSDIAATYTATRDDEGIRLHSSCEYTILGQDLDATWWSISVFDDKGLLIPNSSNRFAYSRDTIALRPNGRFILTLAREARPGNWLPTGGAGRLAVVLQLIEPSTDFDPGQTANIVKALPSIKRERCR